MGMGRGGRGGGAFRCNQPCCVRKPCRQQPELLLPGFVNGHCSVRGAVATASLVQCRLHHHNSHTPTIAFRHPPPKEFAGFTTTATLPPSLSDTLLQRIFADFTTPATLPASLSGTLFQKEFCRLHTSHSPSIAFRHPPPKEFCRLHYTSHTPSFAFRHPLPKGCASLVQCWLYHTSFTPSIAFRYPPPKPSFTTPASLHRPAEPGRGALHTPKLLGQTPV